MPRVALSGAIAVGKTTLAAELASKSISVEMNQEDVGEFRFLSRLYENPARYSFHSRVEFLAIKSRELTRSKENPDKVTLFDRVLPELPTFARAMVEMGTMTSDEYAVYINLHDVLMKSLPRFDAIVWVRCETGRCLQRIAARARPFEASIDATYLNALDNEYRAWFERTRMEVPMLSVDTTSEDPTIPDRILSWLRNEGLLRS
jgi:deoxyadenosine/deoxycytidine kinase